MMSRSAEFLALDEKKVCYEEETKHGVLMIKSVNKTETHVLSGFLPYQQLRKLVGLQDEDFGTKCQTMKMAKSETRR